MSEENSYECDRCGACCKHLLVEADAVDVMREPKLLVAQELGPDRCGAMTEADLLEDESRCILLSCTGPCALLGPDNLCTVYPTRPNVCVYMQAGDENCQKAREMDELEPLAAMFLIPVPRSLFSIGFFPLRKPPVRAKLAWGFP